jgi:clan AA aspartic protease (TIGR02281 family)
LLLAGCAPQAQRQYEAIATGDTVYGPARCGGSGSFGGGPGTPTVFHCDNGTTWQPAPVDRPECNADAIKTRVRDFNQLLAESYRLGCITKETYEANLRARGDLPEPSRSPSFTRSRSGQSTQEEVQLRVEGRNLYVPVRINDTITIPFILDTGANELAVPLDVAMTLARAGALEENAILESRQYTFANGATQTLPRIVIRSVGVGNQVIHNVTATINPARSEPLLGQSFLSRFGTVSIDYQQQRLLLSR